MSNRTISSVIVICLVLGFGTCLQADSIWSRRDESKKNVYADDKARHVGDILIEESTVDNKAKRTLSKETSRSANFNGEVSLEHILPSVPGLNLGGGTKYTNTLDGKADYKDEREFTDSISVVVMDIMPNGNLVVSGTRDRKIAGDIQIIEVSGIIRPNDIAFNNTIASAQIANFSIVSRNKGVAAPYTRPNWLGKIFDAIWPF